MKTIINLNLVLLILCVYGILNAQQQEVKGKVIDTKNSRDEFAWWLGDLKCSNEYLLSLFPDFEEKKLKKTIHGETFVFPIKTIRDFLVSTKKIPDKARVKQNNRIWKYTLIESHCDKVLYKAKEGEIIVCVFFDIYSKDRNSNENCIWSDEIYLIHKSGNETYPLLMLEYYDEKKISQNKVGFDLKRGRNRLAVFFEIKKSEVNNITLCIKNVLFPLLSEN